MPCSMFSQTPSQAADLHHTDIEVHPCAAPVHIHLDAALSFLALFFALGERHPRVASETFCVFSALLNGLKPIEAGDE
ncbi:hypothetical protein B0H11DRAFT_2251424 [Mycena galericulata]|nr:hypothetical protein B0H11DRAFT_2251424 [Mycena galericulata]